MDRFFKQRLAQAVVWYRRAATLFDAKLALGDMYCYGQGVPASFREALRWYREAVRQQDDAYAHYCYGYCLFHGQGAPADRREGARHLRQAAAKGHPEAGFELGLAYYRGDGLVRSPRQAMKWLRVAAGHGHPEARAFLERVQREPKLN